MSDRERENNQHLSDQEKFIVVGRSEEEPGMVWCVPVKQAQDPNVKPMLINVAGSVQSGDAFGIGCHPGHNLINGSMVSGSRNDDQEFTINSVVRDNKKLEDGGSQVQESSIPNWVLGAFHPSGSGTPWTGDRFIADNLKNIPKLGGDAGNKGGYPTDFKRFLDALTTAKENIPSVSSGVKDLIKRASNSGKNPLRGHKPGKLAGSAPNIPKSIGGFATTLGDIKNPTKYLQKMLGKQGEMIPGAFKMMENLKAAAAKGGAINSAAAVGGLSLLQKALAGAANNRSQQNPEDKDDFFCELFKELFPDFQCEIDDVPTEIFLKWKREYIALLQEDEEPMA